MVKKPIDLPPIISVELIQITEKTNIPFAPKAKKIIEEIKTYGNNGFRKRGMVITTEEQYPQHVMIEFVQDKCDLLDNYAVGQDISISINLRGREWINPEGVAKYFNSIQGWRIQSTTTTQPAAEAAPVAEAALASTASADVPVAEASDDLPF